MSDAVTISLRAAPDAAVDVDGITPDRMAVLAEHEIAALPVWIGSKRAAIGDFFDVRGGGSAHVRIEGDVSRFDGLGAGGAAGELVIDGSAGHRVGAGLQGGRIRVLGNVGHDAASGMTGGVLQVAGDAGDRLAANAPGASRGMTGGDVLVAGSAGAEAAARARRGLVVIGGDCGESAARAMIAGTLIVLGRTGAHPGRGSKRGTIVAIGGITVPATYQYACTFQPPHVRLVITYLARQYGLHVDDAARDGLYRRYCGDAGDPGKGEILEWVQSV